MEIVIENDPYRPTSTSPAPTFLRSPVTAQQPPISSSNAFYYATLPRGGAGIGAGRLGTTSETLDGAPITNAVRRVDKSGLEIVEVEHAARQTPSRLLTGAEGMSTLSRRLERSGLLEAVPEVPDQCHRPSLASDELLAAAATARSMVERQQHLLGAETDLLESALLRRRSFATDSQDSTASNKTLKDNEGGIINNNPTRSTQRVKFALDENNTVISASTNLDEIKESRKSSVADCLGKLSPKLRDRLTQMPMSNIPDVIEAHGSTANSTTTTAQTGGTGKGAPEGERAEAEGCEHTAIENVEESRVAFNKSNTAADANKKIGHNDNIQAVHVIILSEQL